MYFNSTRIMYFWSTKRGEVLYKQIWWKNIDELSDPSNSSKFFWCQYFLAYGNCTFRQKIHNFFTRLILSERRSDNSLNLGNQLIHLSKRSSKIFVWVQCSKAIISYGCYVVKCQSRCLRLMFLNQLMDYDFVLWQCRVVEGITYTLIHSSARGKRDGTNFESAQHSICKLCPF